MDQLKGSWIAGTLGFVAVLLLASAFPSPIEGAALFTLVAGAALFFFLKPKSPKPQFFLWIFLAGSALRLKYFFLTPPFAHGHDSNSHADYIAYIVQNAALPPAHDGWEYHQSPLYYVLSAIFWKIGLLIGLPEDVILILIRGFSLLCSIAVLGFGMRAALLLFPSNKHARYILSGLLAVFPLLFFLSGDINNESLHHLITFIFFLLLLRWWKSGAKKEATLLSVALGLGILTRMTSLIFLPVLAVCVLFHPRLSWKKKGLSTLGMGLIIAVIAGWLVFLRFGVEDDLGKRLLGTMPIENLRVSNDVNAFTEFNPVRLLMLPFNDPWNPDFPSDHFWEYAFRSAFFGEWRFPGQLEQLARLILFFAMLCLILVPFGVWRDWKERSRFFLPLLLVPLVMFAALMMYRIAQPCACNQDVRFIPLAFLPLGYFVIRGLGMFPRFTHVIPEMLIAFCGIFLLML